MFVRMFRIRVINDGLYLVEDVGWKGRYYAVELSGFAPDITQDEHRFHLLEPHPGIGLPKRMDRD